MKIAIAGLGYVGMSSAVLLAAGNEVIAVDLNESRVAQVNDRLSPVEDSMLSDWLSTRELDLTATMDGDAAYAQAEFVIVATPTDYVPEDNSFDTSSVEAVIRQVVAVNPEAVIVVKSTIPVGFTARMREETGHPHILFSPEFLREGRALHDNLHPSRIIVGGHGPNAKRFAALLVEAAEDKDVPVLFTDAAEAEAIKLFANTYLAVRVAFFNELDTYALGNGMNARQIIEGISLDPRIGHGYNNPSFGYGGYCLPKDTKQLRANYEDLPQSMMTSVITANQLRKDFISDQILAKSPRRVGIYRLVMKAGSDNFRESAIQGIMRRLQEAGIELSIFEPGIMEETFSGVPVERDFRAFKATSDLILANRRTDDLDDVADKVFTRDVFGTG